MRSDIEVPWWSSELFVCVVTWVLFGWWNSDASIVGVVFGSLLFFTVCRNLFLFKTLGKVVLCFFLFGLFATFCYPAFRELTDGVGFTILVPMLLISTVNSQVDREKLDWHIRLRKPNCLESLLGYEVGEETCSEYPLEYIEKGLFPFYNLGHIAIPLKQSKTGQRCLSLSDLDSWPGSRSLEIDDEWRDIIISRIKDYCAANGIHVEE